MTPRPGLRALASLGFAASALAGAANPVRAEANCGAAVSSWVVCDGGSNPYPVGVRYDVADGRLNLWMTSKAWIAGAVSLTAKDLWVINDGRIVSSAPETPALALSARDSVSLVGLGSIAATGSKSSGISASGAGPIVLYAPQVSATGWHSSGVAVSSTGEGLVDLRFDQVLVSGDLSSAIKVDAAGDVRITAGALVASGLTSQALVVGGRAVSVAVNDVLITSGLLQGIDIEARERVTVDLGTVLAPAGGLDAVFVRSSDGEVALKAGHVETSGSSSGIRIAAPHAHAAAIVNRVITNGDDAIGLAVSGANATAIVTGSITTRGDRRSLSTSDGLTVHALGRSDTDGNAAVTVRDIAATGRDARGILVDATRQARVEVLGSVLAPRGQGLRITAGAAEVHIASDARVGGVDGFWAHVVGRLSIVNAGTVFGGKVIQTIGSGDVLIQNAGLLDGGLSLGEGADFISNLGEMVIRSDWDLGGGINRFDNSGLLRLDTGRDQENFIARVGRFTNSGVIDLSSPLNLQRLTLGGDFVGEAGSRLVAQVVANGFDGLASHLTISGAASGRTFVTINHRQGVLGLLGQAPIALVGAGSAPDAFVLAPSAPSGEFVSERLLFDPIARRFILTGMPGEPALRLTATIAAEEGVWISAMRRYWSRRAGGGRETRSGWLAWIEGQSLARRAETRVQYEVFGQGFSDLFQTGGRELVLTGGLERLSAGRITRRVALVGEGRWRNADYNNAVGQPWRAWSLSLEGGMAGDLGFFDLSVGVRGAGARAAQFSGPVLSDQRVSSHVTAIIGRDLRRGAATMTPWLAAGLGVSPGGRAVASDGRLVVAARRRGLLGAGVRVDFAPIGPEQIELRPFGELSAVLSRTPMRSAILSDKNGRVTLRAKALDEGWLARGGFLWRPAPGAAASIEAILGRRSPGQSRGVMLTLRAKL